jgi:hypothetical protein
MSSSKIKLNNTNIMEYLLAGTDINKTSQSECLKQGGEVIGSGCSTPVYHPDIFFYSLILFIFTFFICMVLQEFRHSAFFPTKVRENEGKKNIFHIFFVLFRFERFSVIFLF